MASIPTTPRFGWHTLHIPRAACMYKCDTCIILPVICVFDMYTFCGSFAPACHYCALLPLGTDIISSLVSYVFVKLGRAAGEFFVGGGWCCCLLLYRLYRLHVLPPISYTQFGHGRDCSNGTPSRYYHRNVYCDLKRGCSAYFGHTREQFVHSRVLFTLNLTGVDRASLEFISVRSW